jgi:hypothetical protein
MELFLGSISFLRALFWMDVIAINRKEAAVCHRRSSIGARFFRPWMFRFLPPVAPREPHKLITNTIRVVGTFDLVELGLPGSNAASDF